jgi:hypothetical protein
MLAADAGLLDKRAGMVDILTGISTALVSGGKGRQLSDSELQFYCMLKNYGGRFIHDLVSSNLLGPHWRTTQRRFGFLVPDVYFHVTAGGFKYANSVLKAFGVADAPCIISEDGTALAKSLDVVVEGHNVFLYGVVGGRVQIHSVEEVRWHVIQKGLASTLYVYELVSTVQGGPHIPIAQFVNRNKFTADDVINTWRLLWHGCREHGITIVGHVSDGDSKLRRADLYLDHHLA